MWTTTFSLYHFSINYKIIYIYNLIINSYFIIFINSILNNISNSNLLNFINETAKYNCAFFILNKKIVTKIFTGNFKFLDSVMSLFIPNFFIFINILNLLNNVINKFSFIFSYKKFISNIMKSETIFNKLKIFNEYNLKIFLIILASNFFIAIIIILLLNNQYICFEYK